jgi:hypothetical protein
MKTLDRLEIQTEDSQNLPHPGYRDAYMRNTLMTVSLPGAGLILLKLPLSENPWREAPRSSQESKR